MKISIKTLAATAIFCVNSVSAQNINNPQWPEITQQAKPWTRWWWEGSAVNKKDLSWMMEEYQKAGLGGLEITPIYGVKGYEKQFIDFVSPKWMEMLTHTIQEGNRLGLGIDMAQASGWPFGGPWVGNEDASKYITYKSYTLKGGEKLSEKVEYIQEPMVRTVGEKIDISKLVEPIAKNPNLQLHAFDQVRFPKPLPLQALVAYSDRGETVDLTSKVDANGKLDWKAPKGNWTLYAAFQGWHGKMVERAGPGGEGYAIDHFSHDATVNYLAYFDKVFQGHDIKPIRAFFNDSYEVDDAHGEADWTPKFFEEFQKRRGYNLKQHLPALFGKDTEEKNNRVLCDYRETISDLLLENYTKTWHDWAKGKDALIRNQAHGSPANILDLYAATDIPEIEGTDILRIKFASSAANVTGKPLISSESATWENEHFLSKLGDVKKAMDLFLLGGVNHTFYHGANYTPRNELWPGWLFYAAVHFTPNNPFWNDFKKLNNYVGRIQSFLQKGRPNHDILLYLPIYDSFSTRGRSLLQHFDGIDHGFKGSSLEETAHFLEKKGYSYDFISDKQLINTQSNGREIQTGGIGYKTVLVPETKFIPLETFKKLVDLAKNGASVVFFKNAPAGVPGYGNLDSRQAEFKKMLTLLNFVDAGNGLRKATAGNGSLTISNDLESALTSAGVLRETMVDQGLQLVRRKYETGNYYFITNSTAHSMDGWVPLRSNFTSAALFNPMTGKTGYATINKAAEGISQVYLQLLPGESCILQTSVADQAVASYPYRTMKGGANEITGTWNVKFVSGGPIFPRDISITKLRSWTELGGEELKNFSGTAQYSISFKKPQGKADAWLLDLGTVGESATVKLNGKEVGTVLGPVYQLEIPSELLSDKNALEVNVSNSMANRIIYMEKNNIEWKKFYNINMPSRLPENRSSDGLFTAAKWQPRPSGIMGRLL